MSDSLYTTILPGSAHWSMRVRRGMQLRFTDVEGGANLSLLMYNPEDLLERYNAPDTLKGQHTFKLTRGNCLYSDMGRVFASMVDDDFGWHDTVCGTLSEKSLKEKYQVRSYQDCHNQWTLSGEHSFLTELAKYGLGERDLAANLNLFSKVITDDDGNLVFDASAARAGASVTLRFEMDTLVILHTCPHPLNPEADYPMKPVQVEMLKAAPLADDDYCKHFRPENGRAFENNRLYHLGL
ncbi:MAG: urea carboxylase-associated protein 2 [Alcanivorax sp.]|jgi:urea carboxylase-associated protein 2|uniref:urea amidolyase associated protein UAAP1 n=1 Tax=Alcanivorax sp. TaxID=1872427 RepID=UPI0039E5989A